MELSEVEEVVQEIRSYKGLDLWDSNCEPGEPICDEVIERGIGLVWSIYTTSCHTGKDIYISACPFYDNDLHLDIDCGEKYVYIDVTAPEKKCSIMYAWDREFGSEDYIKPIHEELDYEKVHAKAVEFLLS